MGSIYKSLWEFLCDEDRKKDIPRQDTVGSRTHVFPFELPTCRANWNAFHNFQLQNF